MNFIRLSDARLQAELSRCMYSLHGFDALMRPLAGQVCQVLMVVSNCIPGSPHACAASAIMCSTLRAGRVSATSLDLTKCVCQSLSSSTACMKLVGGAHGIVRVLEKYRAVSGPVERGVVARLDQRPRLALLFDFALDEIDDVGMVGVEHHHLGRAPRLAARLDHAGATRRPPS